MKKIFILFILSLLIITGCKKENVLLPHASPTAEPEIIKIGIVCPQTGQDKQSGTHLLDGYKMATREVNEKLKKEGKKIELVVKDDFSNSETAKKITKELVEDEDILCILGSYSSGSTLPMSEICRDNKVPLICASGTIEDITSQGNQWVFRIAAPSSEYSKAIIDFLMDHYPVKTIAIMHTETLFSRKTGNYVKSYAQEKGIEVLITEEYGKGMISFKPLLEKIKEKKPDLLYMIAYTEDAPLLMKNSHEVDLNPKVYAGAGVGFTQPELLSFGGEDAEYALIVTQWSKEGRIPGSREFAEKYEEKFKKEATYHSALSYVSLMVFADALERTKSLTREDIRNAIKETNIYSIMGRIRFQDYGKYTNQNKHDVVLMQVQNGEFVPVYPPASKVGDVILPVPPWSER